MTKVSKKAIELSMQKELRGLVNLALDRVPAGSPGLSREKVVLDLAHHMRRMWPDVDYEAVHAEFLRQERIRSSRRSFSRSKPSLQDRLFARMLTIGRKAILDHPKICRELASKSIFSMQDYDGSQKAFVVAQELILSEFRQDIIYWVVFWTGRKYTAHIVPKEMSSVGSALAFSRQVGRGAIRFHPTAFPSYSEESEKKNEDVAAPF